MATEALKQYRTGLAYTAAQNGDNSNQRTPIRDSNHREDSPSQGRQGETPNSPSAEKTRPQTPSQQSPRSELLREHLHIPGRETTLEQNTSHPTPNSATDEDLQAPHHDNNTETSHNLPLYDSDSDKENEHTGPIAGAGGPSDGNNGVFVSASSRSVLNGGRELLTPPESPKSI